MSAIEQHAPEVIPGSNLETERMPGHWLLARLGKRVLRPGGREMTEHLLASLDIGESDDVVELAPGLGATTQMVLAKNPASYVGVDRDPDAARNVATLLSSPRWSVIEASATATGRQSGSADVAFGEAYLTMQPERLKREVVRELARVVRPGGRIGLHEVALAPDDIATDEADRISKELANTIKVVVRPLSVNGWIQLLDEAGFDAEDRFSAPLHLLEPRRLVSDEGLAGALRFAGRVATQPDSAKRVVAMRSAMRRNAHNLQALALTARRRDS